MPIFQEFFDDLSIRVLIADTPLDEAETLANFLRHAQMGYEIRTCSTGRETLLLWGIYQPDLVVLNVDLDGLGGPGVCGDAKKMFGDGLVHIVAISSDVHQSEPIILAAGADRFIKKPINADQVMESIQTILPPGLRGSYSRTKTQN
jgi:CheY-like chemotaxis protein